MIKKYETMSIKSIFVGFAFVITVWSVAFAMANSDILEERVESPVARTAIMIPSAPSTSMVSVECVEEPIELLASMNTLSEESAPETVVEVVEGYVDHGCVEHLYFDVPLEDELQDYIIETCEEKGIDPAIVMAMIDKESKFTIDIVGDKGRSFGLMQIQPRWHEERMKRLGVTDLLDPYQNVTVGIDILGELLESGKSLEWALMAYNGGYAHANRHIEAGTLSSYASGVLELAGEIERR